MEINSIEDLKAAVISSLEGSKAEDITILDVKGKTDFADYMVFATGSVGKHVGAIASRLVIDLKEHDIVDVPVEGMKQCNWVLVDLNNIIVNVFQPEAREFYKLEDMWK